MSVVKTNAESEELGMPFKCFYCGHRCEAPFVHWMGCGEGELTVVMEMKCAPAIHIIMHAKCAGKLAGKFLENASEIQQHNQ